MIEDIRKSINSILYERVTSPLFGTFVISWLVFNWKIFYTTFFIDEDKIDLNKIDYIVKNFNDIENLIWYPLISTLALLTIVPFISNGAYYLSLHFNQWKIERKNEVEKERLLTVRQSIKLREQILEAERKFEDLLEEKTNEINQLKQINSKLTSKLKPDGEKEFENTEQNEINWIYDTIKNNSELKNTMSLIDHYIVRGYDNLGKDEKINSKVLSYFLTNDLIEHTGNGNYKWTKRGKEVNKIFTNNEY